jgi:hypothetical protein
MDKHHSDLIHMGKEFAIIDLSMIAIQIVSSLIVKVIVNSNCKTFLLFLTFKLLFMKRFFILSKLN